MEVVEFFSKGGPVMYLLLVTSIAVVAIGIERFRFYNYAENDSENFLNGLKDRLKNKDLDSALNFCREKNNLLEILACSGIESAVKNENVELALNFSYGESAMKLRTRLNYLSMIVTMAPLLGLLGTIFGMIDAFNIFSIQAGQPLAITGGIGEALIATATGLCISIFALIIHTYFSQRLDEILSKLEQTENIILSELVGKGEKL